MTSRFRFISTHRAVYGVKRLCRILAVSRSGFYRWLATEPDRAQRAAAEDALVAEIAEIHAASGGSYGSPRTTVELRERGRRVNRKRVERLMRNRGIVGRHARRRRRTTITDRAVPPAPDLLSRDFTATNLDQRWCGDITYLRVGADSWLYLATVLDIASRRLIGWSINTHLRTGLVLDALNAAVRARGGRADGVVFHSDRGVQGEFNWSSQHLEYGGVDGPAGGMDEGVDGQVADEVAGGAGASAGCRAFVLV
ncbi:IS3 family transposase [Actinomycetes bacterium KLBMP 9797]